MTLEGTHQGKLSQEGRTRRRAKNANNANNKSRAAAGSNTAGFRLSCRELSKANGTIGNHKCKSRQDHPGTRGN